MERERRVLNDQGVQGECEAEDEAPLRGLRIFDLSTYVAGPSGTMTLAQLGADVIRIDPIGGATDYRRMPRAPSGRSLYWACLNRGKRSIEIDTTRPEGRELVGALVAESGPDGGIVLTNAVGQHWLSFDAMRTYRTDLIQLHITGRSDGRPAVDYTVNCEVGLPLMTGPADYARPVNHVLPAWDLLTGLHAAIGLLVAERARRQTGRGRLVTLSLADVAVTTMGHLGFIADAIVNGRGRPRDSNYLYGSFGCDFITRDSRRVMVVALTERHWRNLVDITGIAEVIRALEASMQVDFNAEDTRYRFRELLTDVLTSWFRDRSYDEVARCLDAAHVLWGSYQTVDELVQDSSSILHDTPVMAQVDQPGLGAFPVPRSSLRFGSTNDDKIAMAPSLGGDTEELLTSILGLSTGDVERLRIDEIVGGSRCD